MFTPRATLYKLSEPLPHDGHVFDFVVVSTVEKDDWGPAETIALPAGEGGVVYLSETERIFAYVKEGSTDKTLALSTLGYDEVLEPVPAES
jgi:hypothetical protein